jgi:hypothetical protein
MVPFAFDAKGRRKSVGGLFSSESMSGIPCDLRRTCLAMDSLRTPNGHGATRCQVPKSVPAHSQDNDRGHDRDRFYCGGYGDAGRGDGGEGGQDGDETGPIGSTQQPLR